MPFSWSSKGTNIAPLENDGIHIHLQTWKPSAFPVIFYLGKFLPCWSFCIHFYFDFGHFVSTAVISYTVSSFRTHFCFTNVNHVWLLVPNLGQIAPSQFVPFYSFRTHLNFQFVSKNDQGAICEGILHTLRRSSMWMVRYGSSMRTYSRRIKLAQVTICERSYM